MINFVYSTAESEACHRQTHKEVAMISSRSTGGWSIVSATSVLLDTPLSDRGFLESFFYNIVCDGYDLGDWRP